jgi:hypothetical protein
MIIVCAQMYANNQLIPMLFELLRTYVSDLV